MLFRRHLSEFRRSKKLTAKSFLLFRSSNHSGSDRPCVKLYCLTSFVDVDNILDVRYVFSLPEMDELTTIFQTFVYKKKKLQTTKINYFKNQNDRDRICILAYKYSNTNIGNFKRKMIQVSFCNLSTFAKNTNKYTKFSCFNVKNDFNRFIL